MSAHSYTTPSYGAGLFGVALVDGTPRPEYFAARAASHWADVLADAMRVSCIAGHYMDLDHFRASLEKYVLGHLRNDVPVILATNEFGLYGPLLAIAKECNLSPRLALLRTCQVTMVTPKSITTDFREVKW